MINLCTCGLKGIRQCEVTLVGLMGCEKKKCLTSTSGGNQTVKVATMANQNPWKPSGYCVSAGGLNSRCHDNSVCSHTSNLHCRGVTDKYIFQIMTMVVSKKSSLLFTLEEKKIYKNEK